jgi:hypothetical protein
MRLMGQISEKRSEAILTRTDSSRRAPLGTPHFGTWFYSTLTTNQFAMFFGIHPICLILASMACASDFADPMVVRISNPNMALSVNSHPVRPVQPSFAGKPVIATGTTLAVACNGGDPARFQVHPTDFMVFCIHHKNG